MGVHNFKRALNNVIIIINKNKQKLEEEEYVKQHRMVNNIYPKLTRRGF